MLFINIIRQSLINRVTVEDGFYLLISIQKHQRDMKIFMIGSSSVLPALPFIIFLNGLDNPT